MRQTLCHDNVGEGVEQGDVRPGPKLQVIVGLDVRCPDQRNGPGIHDDQPRPLAQPALQLRREHRMSLRRIGADDDDHVGLHDRIERLGARRFADGVLQSVAGR